jgi:hypothetical protein
VKNLILKKNFFKIRPKFPKGVLNAINLSLIVLAVS